MNEQIYIIGDVHGCFNTLKALIKQLAEEENSKICFVGDLCDRGIYTKDVIDFIKSNNYDCVLGNHETYFIDFAPKFLRYKLWKEVKLWMKHNGGKETIESYMNDEKEINKKLIYEHIDWVSKLPLYIEYKNYKTEDNRYLVVSHSHMANKWQYKDADRDSSEYHLFKKTILNSRFKDFDNPKIFNVYGHTPTENVIINKYKASIDLGCVYALENKEEGKLCALEFPNMKVFIQECID